MLPFSIDKSPYTVPRKVLIVIPAVIPSVIIGVIRPLLHLQKGNKITVKITHPKFNPPTFSLFLWCDIAVFCRNCEVTDLKALFTLMYLQKKIIYEIDDNFHSLPLADSVCLYHRDFKRLAIVDLFMHFSSITRVYSPLIQKRVLANQGNPFLIKSYFDYDLVKNLQRKSKSSVIKIVYATSRLDDSIALEAIYAAIKQIIKKHKGKVVFHIWQNSLAASLQNNENIVLIKPIRNYKKFITRFYLESYDIGLAPGTDQAFFHSKTNNKYREFGGCGIAGIYSNILPYSDSIEHGVNGLLSGPSTSDWVSHLDALITQPMLRERITNQSFIDVKSNYSLENATNDWSHSLFNSTKHEDINCAPFPSCSSTSLIHIFSDSGLITDRIHFFNEASSIFQFQSKISAFSSLKQGYPAINCLDTICFMIDDIQQLDCLSTILLNHKGLIVVDLSKVLVSLDILLAYFHNKCFEYTNACLVFSYTSYSESIDLFCRERNLSAFTVEGSNQDIVANLYSTSGYLGVYFRICSRIFQYYLNSTLDSDKSTNLLTRVWPLLLRLSISFGIFRARYVSYVKSFGAWFSISRL